MLEENPGRLYQWLGDDHEIQHVTGDENIDRVEALNAKGDIEGVLAELDRWEAVAESRPKYVAPSTAQTAPVANPAPMEYPDGLMDFEDIDDQYVDDPKSKR